MAAIMILPFLWMISTSFKTPAEIFVLPPRWIPKEPALENYRELFASINFGRPFMNTVIVASSITFLSLLISSMAGYAFAKFRFKGRDKLFFLILATLMVPGQMTMIPVFLLLRQLGLLNTYAGLILPGVASAFNIFFMRQFIMTIPNELIEAAKMDGARESFIFFRIILPLSKPALTTIAIFTFTGSWNSFLWPLIIAQDERMYTLPVAVSVLAGQYGENLGIQMAGSCVVITPILVFFLFAQRYFIKGIALTGLKG
ncbi:MAG: carbohydrate ABC transporter permease [Pseudothermotoga sp.]|nr:carbohydrate ABC transporter permease [Pseudothermotoga sp.]HBT38803.1 sugar ABC transporter permease [Pseudothermotoga sp.]HCO98316.1 sugar ABC transporter permease [Pseudothermotoga sp.]